MSQPINANRSRSYRINWTRQSRSGVSLLEVMFAIGVALIGLVGIAMTIPVGGVLARRAATIDAAAQLSSNGAREFRTRGMSDPSNWRWFDGSNWLQKRGAVWGILAPGPSWTPQPFPNAASSFCVDPQFITTPTPSSNVVNGRSNKFPVTPMYGDPNVLWMPRISLTFDNPATSPPTPILMTKAAADEVFYGGNDLNFDLPDDRLIGPIQKFRVEDTSQQAVKRESAGKLSWMATVVPKLDRVPSTANTYNPTNQYTLSIVVFESRVIPRDLSDLSLTTENTVSERVVRVATGAFFSGQPAFGGGDMTLESRATRYPDGADDLELRPGDWVMLTRQVPVATSPVSQALMHKWYRVVRVDEQLIDTGSTFQRDVTLVGPDWHWDTNFQTRVTIARGVVEVHEKTIRLENSSLWAN